MEPTDLYEALVPGVHLGRWGCGDFLVRAGRSQMPDNLWLVDVQLDKKRLDDIRDRGDTFNSDLTFDIVDASNELLACGLVLAGDPDSSLRVERHLLDIPFVRAVGVAASDIVLPAGLEPLRLLPVQLAA